MLFTYDEFIYVGVEVGLLPMSIWAKFTRTLMKLGVTQGLNVSNRLEWKSLRKLNMGYRFSRFIQTKNGSKEILYQALVNPNLNILSIGSKSKKHQYHCIQLCWFKLELIFYIFFESIGSGLLY